VSISEHVALYSSGGAGRVDYAIVKDSKSHGLAEDVLRMVPDTRPSPDALGAGRVLLKMLAAPINPADISCIEGRYPLHPESEEAACRPGFEGVGVVEAVGPGVTRFKPGDLAVPIEAFQGTWRTFATVNENHWYRVPGDLSLSTAATLSINPPTALRMLEELVDGEVHPAAGEEQGDPVYQRDSRPSGGGAARHREGAGRVWRRRGGDG
jgi:NADPH:quinone reductase-like Zn-dependent oxidoreductase